MYTSETEEEKHADMIHYEHALYMASLAKHGGVVEGLVRTWKWRFKKSKDWTVARKAGYARQMPALLRALREKCKMVFIDVKPENFMFGVPGSADEEKIFLIDFGLSTRHVGPRGGVKPQGQSAQIQGTPEFLSLKCHGGASAGRCDDLESLGYVIVSMLKEGDRALPWGGSSSVKDGLAATKSATLEALGCPAGMLQYMTAVRGMEYEEGPDYDKLDAILKSMESAGAAAGRARGGRAAVIPKAQATAAAGGTSTRGTFPSAAASRREDRDVEVCVADRKGKGREGAGRGGATEASAAKVPPAPRPSKQRATAAVRRSKRLSSPKGGEEFLDVL